VVIILCVVITFVSGWKFWKKEDKNSNRANIETSSPKTDGSTLDVTGTYKCRDGMMYLTQTGNKVTGHYDWSGNGVVSGILTGNTLYGTWADKGGSGDIKYVFYSDGSKYEHIWRFTGENGWRTAGPSIKQ